MSTSNQFNRVAVKSIPLRIGPDNNGIANAVTAKLPHGAMLIGVVPASVTAFNGTGTVTLTVTDGTTAFVNAANVKDAAGIETAAATAKAFKTGGTISGYITDQNSDSDAGEAWVALQYIEVGGTNEIYG